MTILWQSVLSWRKTRIKLLKSMTKSIRMKLVMDGRMILKLLVQNFLISQKVLLQRKPSAQILWMRGLSSKRTIAETGRPNEHAIWWHGVLHSTWVAPMQPLPSWVKRHSTTYSKEYACYWWLTNKADGSQLSNERTWPHNWWLTHNSGGAHYGYKAIGNNSKLKGLMP